MYQAFSFLTIFASPLLAQQAGKVTPENHPALTIYKCSKSGGCVAQTAKLVLNSNWRWLHGPAPNYSPCMDDGSHTWNPTLCPDPVTCAKNCALDGADYNQYGITTSGNVLTMLLFPPTGSVGTRVHLLSDDSHYFEMNLKNQEISFDVDVSGLPCGTNGAAYLLNMAADGGQSQYATNQAGAAYGTGYCDAQCPQDPKFINGEANLVGWNPGTQTGQYGSCCHEMDLWEANSAATAFTAHSCSTLGPYRCAGSACGSTGVCDKSGCDYNPYRMNATSFYGPNKPLGPGTRFRIVTQFLTDTGTPSGTLTSINRFYILPSGQRISNPSWSGSTPLSDAYCAAEKSAFGEPNSFATAGGMASMAASLALGMVPTFSVWVDYAAQMLWLDGLYPRDRNPWAPGVARGLCPTPAQGADQVGDLRKRFPGAKAMFANIRVGELGSTFGAPWPS